MTTPFKVLIIGGGPVGLTAAHALHRANIPFTLLESRPSIVIDAGSNLVLLPTGLRILSQLGLLPTLNRHTSPLGAIHRFDHAGNPIGDANFFLHYTRNHGIAPRVVSRHDLTNILYTSLPTSAQASLLPNKRVSSITTTSRDSVTVTCADGSAHTGTILIGADGAHSIVRSQMRSLAQASNATPEKINREHPFLTTYRALWIRFPTQGDLSPGDSNETHGKDCAIQTFVGEETAVIGMYERLPQPTQQPQRWSIKDEEAMISRWGNLPVSKSVSVRQAYDTKLQAGVVSLEEGVVDNWSWDDKIVLVGDAAHKFTPSTGAGCNNGIVDVVVLVNEIVNARAAGEGMEKAFGEYQRARFDEVVGGWKGAGQATATATWQDGVHRFVDLHVLRRKAVQKVFMDRAADGIARTPVLGFVEDQGLEGGRVAWVKGGSALVVA
ncbi:hypothetical protein OQA88_2018 [Cercophora sp. LCS_1]